MEKIKVAMADDNAKFLEELVCRVEEDPACEVVGFAGDGESICKIIRDKQPDVVTLDIIMPRMDGFGVMDDILGDESIKKQPSFLVVSAVGTERIAQDAFEHGADFYYRKPVDHAILLNRIRKQGRLDLEEQMPGRNILREETSFYMSGNAETDVTGILHELSIPPNIKGYHYLRDAILLAVEDPRKKEALFRGLYSEVAAKWETTANRVERSIRHAIDVSWQRGRMGLLDRMFGYTFDRRKDKPTNAEFIAFISDKLSLEYKIALSKE